MIKKITNCLIIAACIGLFLIASFSFASSGAVNWVGYDEGLSRHKDSEKKVLINFYADWCTYCKVMDRETFKDPAVASYLNKNFIPIRVNSDKEKKATKTFRVRGLPDTWFMSEEGEVIGHRAGYIPAETMINMLKYINTDSYKNMSYQKFVDEQ